MLYLALEDPLTRLQNRLLSITEEAPNNLKFAIKSETILGGLKEQIEDFCSQHKDTRFIVIDTLQKIREQKESANQYAQDYKDMNVLKDLAMQFNISILLVHHLRKLEASDPLDMLSGSTGLSGETDGIFLLKKSDRFQNTATLSCTGRDIKPKKIEVIFDEEKCLWITQTEEDLIPLLDPTIKTVVEFLNTQTVFPFSASATELSDLIFSQTQNKISNVTLSKKLIGHPTQLESLGYSCITARNKNGRTLRITKIEE